MKKIYAFAMALMASVAINATTYNLVGDFNSWSNGTAPVFAETTTDVEGEHFSVTVEDLFGTIKIIEDGEWDMQYAGQQDGDAIAIGETYTLKAKDENGEPSDLLVGKEGFGYKNAILELHIAGDSYTLTFVSGEEYDRSALPTTYQIIGSFTDNWLTTAAIEFEDVEGVLTATVPDLNGTFKIIANRGWDEQWATNWETGAGLELNVPYTLGAKGEAEPANLSLANPFGGYKNAVLTLAPQDNGDMVLTLLSGEFYAVEDNWYIPCTKLGWNCDAVTMFTPVEGQANTYELLAAEFEGDFKIVFGNWATEFGCASDEDLWSINVPYTCTLKGNNIYPSEADKVYTDCTITLVVDYENVAVTVTISSEVTTLIDGKSTQLRATKAVENGQLVIIKNGVRYNVLGAQL